MKLYLGMTGIQGGVELKPARLYPPLLISTPPIILIIAPHPDDECLMGSYALRLKQDAHAQVWVLPYSYGSKVARQAERKDELNASVGRLGFKLCEEKISTATGLLQLIKKLNINIVITPHEEDGHPVHQQVYALAKEVFALAKGSKDARKCLWLQTEFWRDMKEPNLLIPLHSSQVVQLGEALMCHQGEIARNPYHLRLPAWFQDQVRKGSEKVAGTGAPASSAVFGQLYHQSMHDI